MGISNDEYFSEVILDDETFNKNIGRLRRTLQAVAKSKTRHLDWVDQLEDDETIDENLTRRTKKFIDGLKDIEPEADSQPE